MTKTIRIFLVGSYGPSLLNFRGPLITALKAAGHEVHVTAPDLGCDLLKELKTLGATPHETSLNRQGSGVLADLEYLKQLIILFRNINPDLIITYTIKPNIWGALAGAFTSTRTVALVTGLGIAFTNTEQEISLKMRVIKRIVRWLYRQATNRNWRVVFQNKDDLADFETAGCLTDRSKVLMMNGSGVDLADFPRTPLPEKPSFLMICRILSAKGVREYARAAMIVKKKHPIAQFRLVGFFDNGPDAISETEVAEWEEGGLEFLGASDNVQPLLAAARVYVLPSYREGTPRTVLEAMATGRAILTSDAPGCRETVVEGVNGYLIPVRNADKLAARMCQMIENPQLSVEMGAASYRIAKEKYDVHKVNAQLLLDLELQ